MRQLVIAGLLVIFLSNPVGAQGFTESNLPIVIINTDGRVNIPDNPRVLASMKIIYRGPGERNYVSDQGTAAYLDYDGRIDIEIRGSSSQASPKKQYGFSTRLADNVSNNNVSLLGMPKENDWTLNGMVFDTAMIRDFLCYNLFRQIGNYASRTAYCEVVINGYYQGLYLLQETIKADKERVDVMKINTSDNSLPGVSGGYITKADKVSAGEPVAWTLYTWYGASVDYIHELPKPENATEAQTAYIRSQFEGLEIAARNRDVSLDNGFPSIIDVPSFTDFMLINELASNPDAYMYSTYFHKDRNGKLRAGPIWDSDLTFGNDLLLWGLDRSKTTGWHFEEHQNDGSTFWRDLYYTPEFKCYLAKRWNELTQPGQPLNISRLELFIDQTAAMISEAVAREYATWYKFEDHQVLVNRIKFFIKARMSWMTANLGSFSGCSDVVIPPLVMSRIMYNPESSAEFPVGGDMEFIEILNNGDQPVDLTGIYFRGTGLVYQFPVNSTLGPHSTYHLASNWTTFLDRYGFAPFGVFTRQLSNQDERLVLADGFGNVIDSVHYYSTPPWPNADGNGSYLKLTDPYLDNSLPDSWIASNEMVVSQGEDYWETGLMLYPNPVQDIMVTEAGTEISSLRIYDSQGRLLKAIAVHSRRCEVDVSQFENGTYIIKVITASKIYSRLVVKI